MLKDFAQGYTAIYMYVYIYILIYMYTHIIIYLGEDIEKLVHLYIH